MKIMLMRWDFTTTPRHLEVFVQIIVKTEVTVLEMDICLKIHLSSQYVRKTTPDL